MDKYSSNNLYYTTNNGKYLAYDRIYDNLTNNINQNVANSIAIGNHGFQHKNADRNIRSQGDLKTLGSIEPSIRELTDKFNDEIKSLKTETSTLKAEISDIKNSYENILKIIDEQSIYFQKEIDFRSLWTPQSFEIPLESKNKVQEPIFTVKSLIESKEPVIQTNNQPEDNQKVCVVCFGELSYAISICGHVCFCSECGFKMNICPICRKEYEPSHLIKIFI